MLTISLLVGCSGTDAVVAVPAKPPSPPTPVVEPVPEPIPPLRVGMSGSYMPMHEIAGNNNANGFEAVLARALGKELHRKVVFVDVKALGKSTLDAVVAGDVDLAMNAITPTPERDARVDFTLPYIELHYRMAGLAGKEDDAVAGPLVVSSTLAERAAQKAYPQAVVQRVRSSKAAVRAVTQGEALGFVAEDVGLVLATFDSPLQIYGHDLGISPVAAAVPEGTDTAAYDAVFADRERVTRMGHEFFIGEPVVQILAELPTAFYSVVRKHPEDSLWEQEYCDDAGNFATHLDAEKLVVRERQGRHHHKEMSWMESWRVLGARKEGRVYTLELENGPLVIEWPVDGNPDLAAIPPGKGNRATRLGAFPEIDGDCDNY